MKTLLSFCLILIQLSTIAQTTIRVRTTDNLQTVINNAATGSTLLLDGGVHLLPSGEYMISKRLTIIGTGYNSFNPTYITNNNIQILNGGENTSISGCILNNITINCDNISILRNRIEGTCFLYRNNISLNGISNFVVSNNIISGFLYYKVSNLILSNNLISSLSNNGGNFLNGIISNNVFGANFGNNTFVNGYCQLILSVGSSVILKNNVIWYFYSGDIYSSYVNANNNIIYGGSISGLNSTNIQNVNKDLLFVGFPNNPNTLSFEQRFQLASGSPAIGAGEGGIDCGIFAGSSSFPLVNTPVGPNIYDLQVPATVQSGQILNVTIKARVSN